MSTEAAMMLQHAISAFRDAMAAEESIDAETADRVVNRVVWGHPDGYVAHRPIEDVVEFPLSRNQAMTEVREHLAQAGLPPISGVGTTHV